MQQLRDRVDQWLQLHWEPYAGSPLAWLFGTLLALVALQTVRLWWAQNRAARRVARHRRLGERGERRAAELLRRGGYRIVEEQVSARYQVAIDGRRVGVTVRADFLVARGRQLFVAEAKSGEESARVTGRATRRQLLEYWWVFDVEGILLVDAHAGTIERVEFPSSRAEGP